jgi:D-aspartate ligase
MLSARESLQEWAQSKLPGVPGDAFNIEKNAPTRFLPPPQGVLVTGADYRALGVVRSLGRRGIPVVVLRDGEHLLAATSRYVSRTISWRKKNEIGDLDFLLKLADDEQLQGWLLVPTDDETVGLVARSHSILATKYALATPSWERLRHACDKRLLYSVAKAAGIACPWTFCPSRRDDLQTLDCSFPVVIKPALREAENPLTSAKAWLVNNRSELLDRYEEACRLMPQELVMIQEFVAGGGEAQFSYAAFCTEGRVVASVVARRTRQFPMDFGRASTFVETVNESGVVEPATRLLTALRMTGLVEVEFKRDSAGCFKLLDVNPRVWGWHTLCARAGVDFSYLLWQFARGEPIPRLEGAAGLAWMRLSTDFPMALKEIIHGRLSLKTYLRSLFGPVESAIHSLRDPIPGLLEFPLLAYLVTNRVLR